LKIGSSSLTSPHDKAVRKRVLDILQLHQVLSSTKNSEKPQNQKQAANKLSNSSKHPVLGLPDSQKMPDNVLKTSLNPT
jgi:hypothetical protein